LQLLTDLRPCRARPSATLWHTTHRPQSRTLRGDLRQVMIADQMACAVTFLTNVLAIQPQHEPPRLGKAASR